MSARLNFIRRLPWLRAIAPTVLCLLAIYCNLAYTDHILRGFYIAATVFWAVISWQGWSDYFQRSGARSPYARLIQVCRVRRP